MVEIFESQTIDELKEQVNGYLDEDIPVGYEVDSIEYSTSFDVIQTKLVRSYSAMVVLVEEATE